MGGSLGLRLKSFSNPPRIIGFGRTESALVRAVDCGAIDDYSLNPVEAVRDADLVVLCAPVMSIPEQMSSIAPGVRAKAVVTDVGSTKAWITAEAEKRLPKGVRFVGSHPMAGSERSGIESADPALYEQAIVVVTPSMSSDEEALSGIQELWKSVGAIPLTIAPDAHDRIVAAISHLPHVAAALLVTTVAGRARKETRTWDLAAGGFRDTTRIASSNPDIWRDICLTNKKAILDILDSFHEELTAFRVALNRDDADTIAEFFSSARRDRDRVPAKGGGLLPSIIDLFVELPDRPGAIAEITSILAAANINIADIEIARVRDSSAVAPLRLLFDADASRVAAAKALAESGYTVRDIS